MTDQIKIHLTVPCDPPSYEDYAQGLKKQQLVVEFDQEIWRVCSICI